jgi:hypothetical protein
MDILEIVHLAVEAGGAGPQREAHPERGFFEEGPDHGRFPYLFLPEWFTDENGARQGGSSARNAGRRPSPAAIPKFSI